MLKRMNKKVIEKFVTGETSTCAPMVLLEASSFECVEEVERKANHYRKKGWMVAVVYYKNKGVLN